jgi:hypothetical protein
VGSYANAALAWDGKRLVIDLRFVKDGKRMVWHEVWSDITRTSFTQTGDIGEAGGPMTRVVTVHGTKRSELPQ